MLYRFLLSLASVPGLLVVLVFDGPRRPTIKRNKRIVTFPFKLEPRLRVVARALGIASHEAPGEAEYEMAKMARDGVVEACWTGDSDILLLDVPFVIRLLQTFDQLINHDAGTYEWETYTSQELARLPVTPTRADLICLATIIGGDYAPGVFHETLGKNRNYFPPPHVVCTILRAAQSKLHIFDTVSASESLLAAYDQDRQQPALKIDHSSALEAWGAHMFKQLSTRLASERTWHVSSVPPPSGWPSSAALSLYLSPITSVDTRPPSISIWSSLSTNGSPRDEFRPGFVRIESVVDALLDFLPGTDVRTFVSHFERSLPSPLAVVPSSSSSQGLPSAPAPTTDHDHNKEQEEDGSGGNTVWDAMVAGSIREKIMRNHGHGPVWSVLLPSSRSTSSCPSSTGVIRVQDPAVREPGGEGEGGGEIVTSAWDVDGCRKVLMSKMEDERMDASLVRRSLGSHHHVRSRDRRWDDEVVRMYDAPVPRSLLSQMVRTER